MKKEDPMVMVQTHAVKGEFQTNPVLEYLSAGAFGIMIPRFREIAADALPVLVKTHPDLCRQISRLEEFDPAERFILRVLDQARRGNKQIDIPRIWREQVFAAVVRGLLAEVPVRFNAMVHFIDLVTRRDVDVKIAEERAKQLAELDGEATLIPTDVLGGSPVEIFTAGLWRDHQPDDALRRAVHVAHAIVPH